MKVQYKKGKKKLREVKEIKDQRDSNVYRQFTSTEPSGKSIVKERKNK